jgi:hypothetical protein
MFWFWSGDASSKMFAKFNTKLRIVHIELVLGQLSHYSDGATCWMVWGLMSGRGKQYRSSSKHSGSETHPASYSLGTGCSFPGGKVTGVWGWRRSPPVSAEMKNHWSYTSAPHISWLCAQGQLPLLHRYAQSDGSGVIVLLLLPNFQLVGASVVLPLNVMKLTVPCKMLIIVRTVNVSSVCLSVCPSVRLYTNAPQMKLYVLQYIEWQFSQWQSWGFRTSGMLCNVSGFFCALKDHNAFIVKVR